MASTSVEAVNKNTGAFERRPAVLRHKISGSDPNAQFPAASGRYILYVSYACPWACRCLAVRAMKGLEDVIKVIIVRPVWERTRPEDEKDEHRGWMIDEGADPLFGARTVRDIYEKATPKDQEPSQVYSVPLLVDSVSKIVVNNESSDIIGLFNREFNAFAKNPSVDMVPSALSAAVEQMNNSIYNSINNGVYRCGFARGQEAYDVAAKELFERLDSIDELLATQRFLVAGSSAPSEADIRLFVTLIRFDEVYVVYFKTNKKMIREYVNIHGWLRDLWQWDNGILQPTVQMDHIKNHYYRSHPILNAHAIVPIGPNALGLLSQPHGRDKTPIGVAA